MINNLNEPEYPKSWEVVKLGDFAESEKGKKPKNQQAIQDDVFTLPYIDIEAFEKNIFNSFTDGEKCVLCSEDDFLMVWDGSRSGLVGKGLNGALGSTLVRINLPMINNLYGYYYLQSKYLEINTRAKGVGIPHVDPALLWNYDFPIPPANEQKRIVDKIETLFSEVDAGIANLTLAKRQLEQYRQSLLKHAFEGKLTAEWRENYAKHTGKSLLTADELLTQIQTARQAHYDQQIKEWEKSVKAWEKEGKIGRKPSKPSKLKPLEPIDNLTDIELPDLPLSWQWERLGLMTLGVEYGTSTKSEKQGLVPVLRMGNMQNGIIDWSDLVYTSDNNEIEKYALKQGDVLFNRTNSPELVGKTSIILSDTKAIFAGYLIRVNQIKSIIDSKYLNYFLGSHIAKQYGNFVKTDGVNQSNINGQKLMNYPFPYCSIDEQKEIVRILEEKLYETDSMIITLENKILKANLLKTSILHKAFQGQLVPQDPNDPPASELLEQIKAERKAQALAEQQAKDAKKKSKATSKLTSKKKAKVKTKATETQGKSAKIDVDDSTTEQGQIKLPL